MQKLKNVTIGVLLFLAWLVLCCVPNAEAQIQATGVVNSNTLNYSVPVASALPSAGAAAQVTISIPTSPGLQEPVLGFITTNTYDTNVPLFSNSYQTLVSAFSVSTPSTLTGCSVSPQVALFDQALQFSLVTLTNGQSSWATSQGLPFTTTGANDVVSATLITAGVGCTGELPITVKVTYVTQANPAMTCSTYPTIEVVDTRSATPMNLATVTLNGSLPQMVMPLFVPLSAGDVISAKVTAVGVGCVNELPINVTLSYTLTAGICYAMPSACDTLTGVLAGPNGLSSGNYTVTFAPSQLFNLAGQLPGAGSGSNGGSGTNPPGLCEALGATPGDICYYNGTSWVILSGNESTEKFLSETTGVPSWQSVIPSGTFYENLIPLWTSNCPESGGTDCTDIVSTPQPWIPSQAYMGPAPGSQGAPYASGIYLCQDFSGTTATATCAVGPLIPGDVFFVMLDYADTFGNDGPPTDTAGDVFTEFMQGGGRYVAYAIYNGVGNGYTTISEPLGADYPWMMNVNEILGTSSHPVNVVGTGTSGCNIGNTGPVFNSITTTAPAAILAFAQYLGGNGPGFNGTFAAGPGYTVAGQQQYGPGSGLAFSQTMEWGTFLTPGTYTPSLTNVTGNCSGFTDSIALVSATGNSSQIPTNRWITYPDLLPGAGFPTQSSATNGYVLQSNGTPSLPMSWVPQTGGASQTALAGGPYLVSTLPAGQDAGTLANVSDGMTSTDCTVGGGADLVTCQYSGSAWAAFIAGAGTPGGSTNYLQYNAGSGNFGGISAFRFSSPNTIAATSSGILDLHLANSFLLPGSLSTGLVTVTTSTGAVSSVAAPAGAVVGTTDTQTLTNKSIAGSEINSGTVANTYLPIATSSATGIVKPDNTTITVDGSGTLSAVGTGSLNGTGSVGQVGVFAGSSTINGSSALTISGSGVTFSSLAAGSNYVLPMMSTTGLISLSNFTDSGGGGGQGAYLGTAGFFASLLGTTGAGAGLINLSFASPAATQTGTGVDISVGTSGTYYEIFLPPNATSVTAGFIPIVSSVGSGPYVQLGWSATPTLGVDNTTAGTLQLANGSSAHHTILASGATTSYTFKFPTTAGTNTYVLQTDGSGNTSWVAQAGSGTVNSGTATHLAYYATSTTAVSDMGADFTFATHTLTGGASAILDLHSASAFEPPGTGGTLTLGSSNINWATLGTGVVVNTTTTGAKAVATAHTLVTSLQCADTSSSATTYACTTTPSLGSLSTGDTFIFTSINQNNSGSSTLNIDGIGAKTIKKVQNTANLASGDLQAGAAVRLTYDGTYLELDTPGTSASGGVTSVALALPASVFSVTGSPVTTTGTLTGTLNNQQAGYVWQGPPSTFQTPFLIQSNVCNFTGAGNSATCAFNNAVNPTDELLVFSYSNANAPDKATDVQGDTFTVRTSNSGTTSGITAPNAVGGATTITITFTSCGGCNLGSGFIAIAEYAGVASSSEFDAAATSVVAGALVNPLPFNAVTTTNANDLVVGLVSAAHGNAANFTAGPGWRLDAINSGGTVSGGIVSSNVTSTGNYIPIVNETPSYLDTANNYDDVIALKAATTPASQAPIFAPISKFTLASGGLSVPQIVYSATATGQTAALTDVAMAPVPTSYLYTLLGTINCTTTSAAATATLNFKYTDTGSTAQTVSATDTCTALVTSGVPNINVAARIKAGTTPTWGVTIANTPTYDVDVRMESH